MQARSVFWGQVCVCKYRRQTGMSSRQSQIDDRFLINPTEGRINLRTKR
jgi:hypothetical protein